MKTMQKRAQKTRRIAAGFVAAATAGAVLGTMAPAAAASAGEVPSSSVAARAAEVVEKATGTADLTKLDGRSGSGHTGEGKVTVTAPETAAGDVRLDAPNADVSLGLPETKGTAGVAAGAGTVVYPDAAPSTDIAVQPTSDGAARTLVTLKDRNAPTTHDFSLKLPEGTRLTEDGENGFLITKSHGEGAGKSGGEGEDTEILGAIDAPWAKDANGKAVPTRYRLDGDKLTQTVDVTADTAFPVVADPKVSLGWSIYLRFSKKEVKDMAKTSVYHFAAVATVMACAKIPNAVAAAGCGAALTAQAGSLRGQMQDAAKANQCVEWKVSYVGVITNWKRYKC
ncbi:hypothetical protein ABZ921_33465 [Streptomyces atriruber]|uniref:Uncharacterized protein n=1 Tax=Streptomyces atriruber TaxID=545121 RepID=A0ABV3BX04_9ACTN